MSIAAMKQAVEALQHCLHYAQTHLQDFDAAYNRHPSAENERGVITDDIENTFAAIGALRAAIEQAQKPVAWVGPSWMDPKTRTWQNEAFSPGEIEGWTPLYTAPQPAQQPLTDEEIMDACSAEWASHPIEIARAIEAKLREKNS